MHVLPVRSDLYHPPINTDASSPPCLPHSVRLGSPRVSIYTCISEDQPDGGSLGPHRVAQPVRSYSEIDGGAHCVCAPSKRAALTITCHGLGMQDRMSWARIITFGAASHCPLPGHTSGVAQAYLRHSLQRRGASDQDATRLPNDDDQSAVADVEQGLVIVIVFVSTERLTRGYHAHIDADVLEPIPQA